MRELREAYIWAHIKQHGTIHRNCLIDVFGISRPQSTVDLRNFQEKYGELIYDHGSRTYCAPEGYSPNLNLEKVASLCDTYQIILGRGRHIKIMKRLTAIVEYQSEIIANLTHLVAELESNARQDTSTS